MRSTLLAVCAAVSALALPPAVAASYSITDLGQLPSTESGTSAYAVNSKGQVAGYSGHPFLWDAGTLTDLNPSLSYSIVAASPAKDVNDNGVAVGSFQVNGNTTHPFRYAAGTFQDLAPSATTGQQAVAVNNNGDIAVSAVSSYLWKPDGTSTVLTGFSAGTNLTPFDVNDTRQVAGTASTVAGSTHAALWGSGTAQDLGVVSGDVNSTARAINATGAVVGDSYGAAPSSTAHAFLWRNGVLTPLPARTAGESAVATAINDLGQIVGYMGNDLNLGGEAAALFWDYGQVKDLQTLLPAGSGWTLSAAMDINDAGQITGYGIHNGVLRAFLLTPVPPQALPGDAHNDKAITMADAALVLEMAIGSLPAGDVPSLDVAPYPTTSFRGYGDGRLDALDALRILRRAAGLETHWP